LLFEEHVSDPGGTLLCSGPVKVGDVFSLLGFEQRFDTVLPDTFAESNYNSQEGNDGQDDPEVIEDEVDVHGSDSFDLIVIVYIII
jgi:hypothetical protein